MDAITSLSIDVEFKKQLWPLSPVEFAHLEQSLLSDGCRESLIAWEGHGILVDGHNRYELCTRNGIAFDVEYRAFSDRDAVADWIDKNQASRRNCTPDQYRIITGRIYNRRKKSQGGAQPGNKHAEKHGDQIEPHVSDRTADEVAAELGVSAPTIKRNAQRAEVHDTMLAIGDNEAAEAAKTAPQSAIAEAKKKTPQEAAESLKKPHVSNNSGEHEWYTPAAYLEAARGVLGEIDLDPASSEVAQRLVQAKEFYTRDDNGLLQDWRGRVWMNPPYSSGLVDKFADKLVDSINAKSVKAAVVMVNNATDTRWFHMLASNASAICFTRGRVTFLDSEGTPKNKPLQGQAIVYFGKSPKKFVSAFKQFGFCVEGITSVN